MTSLPRPLSAALLAALTVLPLAACGGGSSSGGAGDEVGVAAAGPDAQTITIDSTDKLEFVPAVVAAQPGTLTITLTNSGQSSHDLVFDDDALPAIGTVTGGKQLSMTYTFAAPGTYPFVCTFHNGMDGKVVVG